MQVETALSGIYQHSDNLVRVRRDVKRGRATKEELNAVYRTDAEKD